MLYRHLVCFFFLFACLSCKQGIRDTEILQTKEIFSVSDSLELWGKVVYYVECNDTSRIFCFSRLHHTFTTYRKNDDIFLKESEYIIEDSYNNVYVKNNDSIFLFHDRTGYFTLIDSKKQTLESFTIPLIIDSVQYMILNNSSQNIVIKDNKIVLTIFPYSSLETFYNHHYELMFNLEKRSIEEVFLKFPSGYKAGNWWGGVGNNYKKCLDLNHTITYSFPMTNTLYTYRDNKIEPVEVANSHYFSTFPPKAMEPDSALSSRYSSIYADTIGYYQSILFDPYRNIYLRIAAHPQTSSYLDEQTKTLKKNLFFDREWSILFFDHNFKLIGEQKFNGKTYFFNSIFITKKGILVALGDGTAKNGLLKFQFFTYKNL